MWTTNYPRSWTGLSRRRVWWPVMLSSWGASQVRVTASWDTVPVSPVGLAGGFCAAAGQAVVRVIAVVARMAATSMVQRLPCAPLTALLAAPCWFVLAVCTIASGYSLSLILPTPMPSLITAPVALVSSRRKSSAPSAELSSRMPMVTVFVVSPGAKVTVPLSPS